MELAEIRRRFAAYASGELSEGDLRRVLRTVLVEEPMLSPVLASLAESYRRANVIDEQLQTDILADIAELTGPRESQARVRGSPITEPTRIASVPAPADRSSGTGSSGSWFALKEGLAQSAAPLARGSVLKDRYELVDELGRGGMGVVYKALDRVAMDLHDRHCHVAVKVLNEEFKRHPQAVRAMQREARRERDLAHPNIMGVYDFDRDGGNVFMVMELLSGHSLDQVIRAEGPLSLHRAVHIVQGLGAALQYAHDRGIIHSDFKPSNAFITDAGVVKVLDFGIARTVPRRMGPADQTTFDAGQLGAVSLPYASVEMLNGEQPDERDDVYALAAVAYELLTARHPFNRIDALKARLARLEPEAVRGLSRARMEALRHGLAFSRQDRTPSIKAFVAAFASEPARASRSAIAGAATLTVAALLTTALVALAALGRWKVDLPDALKAPQLHRLLAARPARVGTADVGRSLPMRAALASRDHQFVHAAAAPAIARVAAAPSTERVSVTAAPTPSGSGSSDVALARARLEQLIEMPAAKRRWSTAVHQAIDSLAGLTPSNDPLLASARKVGLHTYLQAEGQARDAQNWALAAEFLKTAESFDPGSPQLASEEAALEEAHTASPGTEPAPHPAHPLTARESLLAGIETTANSQLEAGQLDEAQRTIAAARCGRFGKDQQLKDMDALYAQVGDIYDRLRGAVSAVEVTDQRQALEGLRAPAGDRYPIIEHMLAQTLANRIADLDLQVKHGNPPWLNQLRGAGKQIFPSLTQVLDQGTPGRLTSDYHLPADEPTAGSSSGAPSTDASSPPHRGCRAPSALPP